MPPDGLFSARLVLLVLPALVLLAAACEQSPKTLVDPGRPRHLTRRRARQPRGRRCPGPTRPRPTAARHWINPRLPDSAGDSTSPDSAADLIPSPDMDPFPVGRFGCMGTVVGGLSPSWARWAT